MQLVKSVECTFEDELQTSSFKLNNGVKSITFNVVEQAFAKIVQSVCAPTVSAVLEAKMPNLVCPKAVADKIFEAVLYNTGSIAPNVETVGNMEGRAIDEE